MDSRTHQQWIRDSEVLGKEEEKDKGVRKGRKRKRKTDNVQLHGDLRIVFLVCELSMSLLLLMVGVLHVVVVLFSWWAMARAKKDGCRVEGMESFGSKHS
jgi:hypothetical protein